MLWGILDILTLNNPEYAATEAANSGYGIGQFLGIVIWAIFPILMFIASGIHLEEREDNTDDAG